MNTSYSVRGMRRPPVRPAPRRVSKRLLRFSLGIALVLALLAVYGYYCLQHPLPPLQPSSPSVQLTVSSGSSKLTWPTVGQSAMAVVDTDILETHGTQTSVPTASTAKIITALTILHDKPLTPSEPGPTITLGAADVALYNQYVAKDGSVVPVSEGEQITEYQMLEALMLPSANNIADSMAIWAYGSLPAYSAAADKYIASLGLKDTHIGSDASGFDPSTTSSAHDLAIIGAAAMKNPVLASIVAKASTADIPGLSISRNVNFLLGSHNIVGIKTGNTDEAGGVYVSAATVDIAGRPTTIVTALVGAPTLYQALTLSLPLIDSPQTNFMTTSLLASGAVVAEYRQPWGGSVQAIAGSAIGGSAWRGSKLSAIAKLQPISITAQRGQLVGEVSSPRSSLTARAHADITLASAPTQPSRWWRLTHPFN